MRKFCRYVLSPLCLFAAVSIAMPARAASPFNGTWKTDISQTKWSPKPLIFYTSGGWYHCVTCNPTFDVPADGQDHVVAGQPYDTIAITIVDKRTISTTTKKDGKATSESTRTVSADGKTLTVHSVAHPKNSARPLTFDTKAKRDGVLPPGVHATSGRWVTQQIKGSEEAYTTTLKVDGDRVSMTQPNGENYTATLGGGDSPFKGAYGYDAVSVRRLNPNTIEETDKRDGRIVEVYTMTVSPGGKMMTIVDSSKLTGRTSTMVAKKQ